VDYNRAYRSSDHFFGIEPEPILKEYYTRLRRDGRVLDIGVGQGRNTLFLARKGFPVDCIDPSTVALETVSAIASGEALPVRTYRCGFETFVPDADSYSGILIFGLIQTLRRESVGLLVDKAEEWTTDGSLVFVTAFTTADPSYEQVSTSWRRAGRNCFTDGAGEFRTYLESGEILTLFHQFQVLYHWEGIGPQHRHGDRPPHRHGSARVVFDRPTADAEGAVQSGRLPSDSA
jgi:tellurite methyltransferase